MFFTENLSVSYNIKMSFLDESQSLPQDRTQTKGTVYDSEWESTSTHRTLSKTAHTSEYGVLWTRGVYCGMVRSLLTEASVGGNGADGCDSAVGVGQHRVIGAS